MAGSLEPAAGYVSTGIFLQTLQSSTGMPLIDPIITMVAPANSPLMNLLTLYRRVAMPEGSLPYDGKFQWMEYKELPIYDYVATAAAAGTAGTAMSLVVVDGDLWPRGSVGINMNTGEQFIVESVSTNTLSIKPAFAYILGGTTNKTPQPWTVGDPLIRLTVISGEAAEMGDAVNVKPEFVYTYFTEHRWPVVMSDWAKMTKLWPNIDQWDFQMKKAAEQMATNRELWALYSQSYTATYDSSTAGYIDAYGASTTVRRYVGSGVIEQIKGRAIASRCVDISGTLTKNTFLDKVGEISERMIDPVMFAWGKVTRAQNFWKDAKLADTYKDENINLVISSWELEAGKQIKVIRDNYLGPANVGTDNRGGIVLLLDMAPGKSPELIQWKAPAVEPVILANGVSAEAAQTIGIEAIAVRDANNHGLIYNIRDVEK